MPEEFEAGVKFVATDEGVAKTTDEMGTAFQRTTKRMKEFVGQSGYVRLALTRIVTYTAIFTFFGTLAKMMGEVIRIQHHFAEVSTLVDMRNQQAAKSFRVVTEDLIRLSPYLGYTADLVKGLYEIMSAGVSKPIEAFKLLVVSARYAKAGITDLATAASSLTAVMKAYGYSADEMREKSDMLFASVMEGKYHAAELNQAIGKVLPTAAAMGVQIDEVSAALAVLTQRGLDVNEAATALNRMLLAVLRPIDKAKKEFVKLGLAWGRDALVGQGLLGFLRRLMEAQTRYGDLLPKIFRRQRALRGAFVLAGEGFKDYIRLLNKIRSATEDGGEVQRAYGKMIGTVSEEFKAATAKITQSMYQIWKGENFEALGKLVQALGSLLNMFVKSADIIFSTIAALAILRFSLKVVTKFYGAWVWGMDKTNKMLKKGTNLLTVQTGTLGKHATALKKSAMALRFLKGAMVAGLIVYIAVQTAIDLWTESIYRQIGAIHEAAKAKKKFREAMELTIAAAKRAGVATGNVGKQLYDMARRDVAAIIKTWGDAGEIFKEVFRILKKKEGYTEAVAWKEELWELAKALASGGEVGEEHNAVLLKLAKTLGILTRRQREWNEEQRLNLDVAHEILLATRFLARVQRDWNKAAATGSMHAENIAREFSTEELKGTYEMLSDILSVQPDTPSWKLMEEYFASMGKTMDEVMKLVPKYMERIERAMKIKPGVEWELGLEEVGRELEAITKQRFPDFKNLQWLTRRLGAEWVVWQENIKDTDKASKAFVEAFKAHLTVLETNYDRLGAKEKQILQDLPMEYLHTKLTAQQKAARDALKIQEQLAGDFLQVESQMQQLRNELRGEEYNNIVAQTEKAVKAEKIKLEKWLKLEMAAESDMRQVWKQYASAMKELDDWLMLARQAARQRRFEAEIAENKQILEMDYAFTWQRIAVAEQMYDELARQIKNAGDVSDAELQGMKQALAEFLQYIAKLRAARTAWTDWIEGMRFAGRMLASVVSSLNDFVSVMGISGGAIKRFINVLDALAKGCRTVEAGLKMIEWAASDAVTGLAASLAKIGGWVGVAVGAVTALVSVFGALFGKKKKTEAEIMAERIAKVQRELRNFGRVSEGVARQFLDLKKQIGTSAATLELLVDIMNDAGVTTGNFTEYLNVLLDTLDDIERSMSRTANRVQRDWENMREGIERGRRGLRGYREEWRGTYHDFHAYSPEDVEKAIIDLGAAFVALIEHAKRLGLEGSPELVQFIQEVRELGLEIKEVDDYVYQWLGRASEGLTAMIEASTGTREELANLGELTLATFNALIEQGMGYIEALELMAEPLHELRRRYRDLGEESNAAVEQLMHITSVAEKYQDLFAAISGTDEVLQALGNTGFLTQESLTAVAEQAQTYYERLTAAGLTSQEALAVMAPILENLQKYADNYGLSIDANTQSLIDQAAELGVLKIEGASVTDVLQSGFDAVVSAINNFTNSLSVIIDQFIDVADTGTGSFDQITDSINTTADAFDSLKEGLDWEGIDKIDVVQRDYQHGARNIGYTQIAQLHRGESVIPEGLADALRQFYGGMSGAGVSGGEGGLIHNVINIDGREVYRALVPYIREGGEVGDFEVAGEAVQ